MTQYRSRLVHRAVAAAAILGITGIVYADHCRDLQLHTEDCGDSQVITGLDCSYWTGGPDPVFVSCPNLTLYVITAAPVHICLSGQEAGASGCESCGIMVYAQRQKYKCAGLQTCQITEDGSPENYGEGCCSAELTGTPCGH